LFLILNQELWSGKKVVDSGMDWLDIY